MENASQRLHSWSSVLDYMLFPDPAFDQTFATISAILSHSENTSYQTQNLYFCAFENL
jgi:hypothetical protein